MNRREFLQATAFAACVSPLAALAADVKPRASLAREVGITTGSFMPNIRAGKFRLLDLPHIMRDELGMRVIDLMTATLESLEPDYLERLRAEAERAGCVLTNLKMNQPGLEMASPVADTRRKALDEYKRTIDAAARLGVRWVRPLPGNQKPDLAILAASYRELIDYGAPRGITLLVENFGWMQSDPEALPAVVKAAGQGCAAQPDTGNWANNEVRYPGLAKAFPLAVTCDFKAKKMGPDGAHADYDLKRCFDIGWNAGFRGPWCIEHPNPDLKELWHEMRWLRDRLQEWMAGRGGKRVEGSESRLQAAGRGHESTQKNFLRF
ncbi:MAG: TIM barrel protein [Verrucomicrobiota bacterium]